MARHVLLAMAKSPCVLLAVANNPDNMAPMFYNRNNHCTLMFCWVRCHPRAWSDPNIYGIYLNGVHVTGCAEQDFVAKRIHMYIQSLRYLSNLFGGSDR